ncbi:MAG: hypothetical protein HDT46_04815 [Ruminococcaceae bacterium]|nr:hypothetical protein [Oscillospiraceae bacterium]
MTLTEQLSELALPQEKLKQIYDALKAEYVPKDEYKRLSDNLSALKTEHKKKADYLRQAKEDALNRQKTLYEQQIKEHLIELALKEAGAKNNEIVRSLLDMEKITLNEGKTVGLTSQLTQLRKNAPFLFEDSVIFLTGYRPEASSDILPKVSVGDMTYSEAVAYLEKNRQ